MFSLPRKISTSLGILSDDAKLLFRTQPAGLRRLAEVRNLSPTDDTYWSQYATLFDSPSDVYSLISPHDIKRVITEAPENLATLINVLSKRLFNLITDITFPSQQSTLPPVVNFAASWGSETRDTTKEVLNCLRVLGRILPVVFETETSFEYDLLWKREKIKRETVVSSGEDAAPQFVIAEDEDEETSPIGTTNPSAASEPREELAPALADRLLSTTIDLMFCCGFTLPKSLQVDHHKINYTTWEKGIGSTQDVTSSTNLDQNKTEVLRFLQILLSKTIYFSPTQVFQLTNPYASRLVHKHQTPRRQVLSILCSLLNTTMNSAHRGPSAAGLGAMGSMVNGVGTMVKDLPYNHLVFKDESHATMVSYAIGVLLALLDYQSGDAKDVPIQSASDTPVAENEIQPSAPTASSNSFRYFLAKLHRPSDFDYILNGVLAILEHHMAAVHHVLPGSRKGIPYTLETFLFFWKMIDLNKKFRAHVLESDRFLEVFGYLLWFCLESKDKPQLHGQCRALSYMIQSLSAESSFGLKMAFPIPNRVAIPSKWYTTGNAGDFLVTSIYSMVATTSGTLNFLYPALIIALSNAAPYLKDLQVASSAKLVQLFTSFASPAFVLADESHPRLLFFTLEVFNQIIVHQLSSNPNLIYAILRSHQRFEQLGTFTLSKGIREIERIKEAKEESERIRSGKGDVKGKSRASSIAVQSTESPGLGRGLPSLEDVMNEKSRTARVSSDSASRNSSSTREGGEADQPLGPIAVPPTPTVSRSFSQTALSEKARGKMKESGSGGVDEAEAALDPESERVAAMAIGRNGFVPTQEWVASWQQGLPLDVISVMISELLPKVHDIQAASSPSNVTAAILSFLSSANLTGVLPPAPPIAPRKFMWSEASYIWLCSLTWGEIYVKGTSPLSIWTSTNVKLFGVRHTPQPTRGVTNFVGGLLGNGTPTNSPGQRHTRVLSRQVSSS
ncbi:hypothetical protein FRC03_000199 [Tulasnella sp. 419]|nr:hypothetical protein FRC03_000199 [Tulasnella sp. 419]